jgi:hypothetical protein
MDAGRYMYDLTIIKMREACMSERPPGSPAPAPRMWETYTTLLKPE